MIDGVVTQKRNKKDGCRCRLNHHSNDEPALGLEYLNQINWLKNERQKLKRESLRLALTRFL